MPTHGELLKGMFQLSIKLLRDELIVAFITARAI